MKKRRRTTPKRRRRNRSRFLPSIYLSLLCSGSGSDSKYHSINGAGAGVCMRVGLKGFVYTECYNEKVKGIHGETHLRIPLSFKVFTQKDSHRRQSFNKIN